MTLGSRVSLSPSRDRFLLIAFKDRMWRKTRSRVPNSRSRGCVGVDANRNFDYQWLCKLAVLSASCISALDRPSSFYPRDAMLARVFAIATCLSVHLSVRLSAARRYCA